MRKVVLVAFSIWALFGIQGAPAGTYGEVTFSLADPARGRQVEVLLLYPLEKASLPLVVLSPGFLLAGPAYRSWGEFLASQGMATALVSYRHSLLNPDHRVLLQDLLFVLDTLPKEARA